MNQREIGKRLKKRRKEMGFTQTEVAERLGLGRNTTISGWETGAKGVNNQKLTELAQMYEVSVDYLIGNTDELDRSKEIEDLIELPLNESWERFALVVDGKRLTKGQTKRLIAYIRAERTIENE